MNVTEKSTKAQIMEAYNQAQEELKALRAMNDSPAEQAKAEALSKAISNAEVAANNEVFNEAIIKQYRDLQTAIEEYGKQLEDLYGIKSEADGLAAAINAHKTKVFSLEAEYAEKKNALAAELVKEKAAYDEQMNQIRQAVVKAKQEAKDEIAEHKAYLEKQHNREEEEYEYDQKIARKKDADAWAMEKAQREAEIKAKEDVIEARELAVMEEEDKITEMKEMIEAFPAELEAAKEEAAKDAKAKADKSFAFEKRALETEKAHATEMANAQIDNLKAQVADLTSANKELSEKLNLAYMQMKDMATTTVQAGATVKVVSAPSKE